MTWTHVFVLSPIRQRFEASASFVIYLFLYFFLHFFRVNYLLSFLLTLCLLSAIWVEEVEKLDEEIKKKLLFEREKQRRSIRSLRFKTNDGTT